MNIFELYLKTITDGGASVSALLEHSQNKKGFMVSLIGTEKAIEKEDYNAFKDAIIEKQGQVKGIKQYIGTWYNTEDGKIYIDISVHYNDKRLAIENGLKNKQLAIYDVENDNSIYLEYPSFYTIYKYNSILNDLIVIAQFETIENVCKFLNIKKSHFFNNISKNIEELKLINKQYAIFKDVDF